MVNFLERFNLPVTFSNIFYSFFVDIKRKFSNGKIFTFVLKRGTTLAKELNNLFYVLDDLETKVEYNNYEDLRPKLKPRTHNTTACSYPNNVNKYFLLY